MWAPPKPCRTCGRASVQGTLYCEEHQANAAADRAAAQRVHDQNRNAPWRKWYNRVQWKNLRQLALHRHPICTDCGRAAATEADHIVPHRGDYKLFTDLNNLTGLCKPCHDKKTGRGE